MRVTVGSVAGKSLLMLVESAVLLLLIGWVGRTYFADALARRPTVENLERAVQMDPGNAELHVRLGRLYEYDPVAVQPPKAEAQFRRATQISPDDPEPWMELAAALEFQGRMDDAKACLDRVDLLAPHLPAYQWPIGNFYLLQGNTDDAFGHFRMVLAGTSDFDQNVFSLAWRATDDPAKILQEMIPPQVTTEISYLDFLIGQHHLDNGQAVWQRIAAEGQKFPPEQIGLYMDSLILARQADQAYQVWTELQKKGLIRNASSLADDNLIFNGDFEDDLLNQGFAWRILPLPDVSVGLDTSNYHSASHAILVRFPGKENLQYQHLYQYVKVTPGQAYRLQAFMKTEGITTDSGPRLEVVDAYDPKALDVFTDDTVGSSDGWMPLVLDFSTGPNTGLVMVRLARLPSRKLDNAIAGEVWLDDVQLTPKPK